MSDAQTQDCEGLQAVLPDAILCACDSAEADAAWVEHAATCMRCQDTLKRNADLTAQILLSDIDLEQEVPAKIKLNLMAKIKSVAQQKPGVRFEEGGLLIVRSAQVPWRETGIPGMQWRPFSSKRYDNRSIAMFRLDAGASVPGHRHEGVEELYMLSGTLLVEGVRMNPGDYCRAEFGSMHAPVTALTTCEFLLSSDSITYFQ